MDVISTDKLWLMRVPVGSGPAPRLAWMLFNYYFGYAADPDEDPMSDEDDTAWTPG